jgi:dihydroorotate dehydrogenase electron transfer subunit
LIPLQTHNPGAGIWCRGRLTHTRLVSSSMYLIRIQLETETGFRPGQFCMLNVGDAGGFVLGRPLSILAVDGLHMDLLYKVVGGGTGRLADLQPGAALRLLTPLGTSFPQPVKDQRYLLLAGGVGLPPLHAWRRLYPQADTLACFGGRDGNDVPWELLDGWRVSVDQDRDLPEGREAFVGNVVQLAETLIVDAPAGGLTILSCGPHPLLKAAATLARDRGHACYVSMEERMGCGYGACRGCVTPVKAGGYQAVCEDGPVFAAETLAWDILV